MSELTFYKTLLIDIKQRIRQAQTKAILSANSELIAMYWDIGKMLEEKQKVLGWGAAVIPRLSKDIHNELPEIKGLFGTEHRVYDPFCQRIRGINFATGCCKITGAGFACRYSLGSSLLVD